MRCPLCKSQSIDSILIDSQKKEYFLCTLCDLRFLNPIQRLGPEEEKQRYLEHNNDIQDPRYQNFANPLGDEIRKRCPLGASGLDFGAGTGPVLASLLTKENYQITLYDPLFHSDRSVLEKTYDFVYAIEVVEHFFEPQIEFLSLKKLVKPKGVLAMMTLLYDSGIDFREWYYRRDPTHVVFYSQQTFEWIGRNFGFGVPQFVGNRIVVFELP